MNNLSLKEQADETHSNQQPHEVRVYKRPCFVSLNKASTVLFENKSQIHPTQSGVLASGLYYFDEKDTMGVRIASHIEIIAITCDENVCNFGIAIEIKNKLGKLAKLTLPMELFAGTGSGWQSILLNYGIEIEQRKDAKSQLANYLQTSKDEYFLTHNKPLTELRCTNRTGWYDDSYVLPHVVIGDKEQSAGIVYQSTIDSNNRYKKLGSVGGWTSGVARHAERNPLLSFSLSCAFAAPLLDIIGGESGGFHIFGNTSTGKSTVLEAAASVWGNPRSGTSDDSFLQTWRATANGLEAVCAAHNDCLLPLDEISQADPKELADIVYMIGNGIGKSRMNKSITQRRNLSFRVVVLSTGEQPIVQAIQDCGLPSRGGQEIRILDIDSQRQYGVFDELTEGFGSGEELSTEIKNNSRQNYGHVGIDYLQYLVKESKDEIKKLFNCMFESFKSELQTVTGANLRVMKRFVLVALAGELATRANLTGWDKGQAKNDCKAMFEVWLASRPKGDSEAHKARQQLMDYIDRHESKFECIKKQEHSIISDRVGYYETVNGSRMYWFFKPSFESALKGLNINSAKHTLSDSGILIKANDGKYPVQKHIPALNASKRLYQIDLNALLSEPKDVL